MEDISNHNKALLTIQVTMAVEKKGTMVRRSAALLICRLDLISPYTYLCVMYFPPICSMQDV